MNSYTRITSIDEMLKSLEAITIGRNNIKSFTRNRKMDFYTITTSMIYKKGQTLSLEISEFTERMKKKEITKQAYSKQRKNLNPEIFKYLNENYIKKIYKEIEVKKYKGYIVLSVDASSSTTTCTTNTYETLKGQAASTTGNITGIYDMNGGAYDRVMGVYNRTVGSSGINFSTLNAKYYDNYTTTNATTSCNQGVCYGHALSETIGWYNDYDSFVDSSNAWFFRDGGYGNTSVAGVFFFCGNNGDASSAYSFRIVLSRAQ